MRTNRRLSTLIVSIVSPVDRPETTLKHPCARTHAHTLRSECARAESSPYPPRVCLAAWPLRSVEACETICCDSPPSVQLTPTLWTVVVCSRLTRTPRTSPMTKAARKRVVGRTISVLSHSRYPPPPSWEPLNPPHPKVDCFQLIVVDCDDAPTTHCLP